MKVENNIFPLKVTKETYYAGMGVYESRYVLSTSDGKAIAKDDYMKVEQVDKLNAYVKELEDEIKKLKKKRF